MRVIVRNDRGDDVRDVQRRLLALGLRIEGPELEGWFGQSTEGAVREFQQRRDLLVDGKVGSETWSELVEAGYALGDRTLYLRYPYFRGDDVRELQHRLNAIGFDAGREDGIFGERCDRAVRDFQRNVGMDGTDGIVGVETLRALQRVGRPVEPDPRSRAFIREAESLRALSPSVEGVRVAIDPGHSRHDVGGAGPTGLAECDAAFTLADALASELIRRGAEVLLLREEDEECEVTQRASRANEWGAEACISIHLNAHSDPSAEGSAAFYFGNEMTHSPAGRALAESLQEELTERLGLKDGRVHRKNLAILRETRMPAAQVEPCFITNPREERWLREEAFQRDVAIALVHGLERFFGAQSPDAHAEAG